jgi:hypothetical protein
MNFTVKQPIGRKTAKTFWRSDRGREGDLKSFRLQKQQSQSQPSTEAQLHSLGVMCCHDHPV